MSKKGRKRKMGTEDKAVVEWEDRILPESLREEMETMWEIPQIYHFLQLTKEVLNISHLSMYEVERMLLMPKASKQLAHVMTCLLSSPSTTKAKLHRVPPMPYDFWTNILSYKLRSWFKMYQTKHEDPVKVFDALGVEPEFWKVFPDATKIEGKDFLDFSFKQRVWLLKTVCDTAMHSRKTIQDEMAKQPMESQFETVLGIDRYGARYVYFPQFLHNDLRVYRHCLDNKVLSTVKPPAEDVKPKLEDEEEVTVKDEPKPVKQKRKPKKRRYRWSNGALPPKKSREKKRTTELYSIDPSILDSNSNSVDAQICQSSRVSATEPTSASSSLEANHSLEPAANSRSATDESNSETVAGEPMKNLKAHIEESSSSCEKRPDEETETLEDLSKSVEALSKAEDSILVKENNLSVIDDLSKSSKTDDEKLEEISSLNASKVIDKSGDGGVQLFSGISKDVNISKSDDEKLSESKKCDTLTDSEFLNDEMSQDISVKGEGNADDSESDSDNDDASDSALSSSGTRRSARIKNISDIKLEVEDVENMLDVSEGEALSSVELRDILCRVSSPEVDLDYSNEDFSETDLKVENFSELISDLSESKFQLVADSLDSLKDLTESICSDKTIVGYQANKEYFIRSSCEEKLIKRMKVLSASLEKVETLLKDSMKKARNKLQREWNNFENGVVDEDQEAQSEDGPNRWLLGSQGGLLETICPDRGALPRAAVPAVSPDEQTAKESSTAAGTAEASADAVVRSSPDVKQPEAQDQRDPDDAKQTTRKEKEESPAEEESEPEQTTRVLRARGISSYTEQLFSDEESEEEKLDGWTDIEAIYSTPSTQANASTPHTPTKSRDSCNDSEDEDSDQDWILPSSRKRKNKRPSASRRLKSFQYKLQNIKVDQDGRSSAEHRVPPPQPPQPPKYPNARGPVAQIYPRRAKQPPTAVNRQVNKAAVAPTTQTVPLVQVKTEPLDPSLHTVLDIKDEGPVYDGAVPSAQGVVQPNYVVVTSGHAPVGNYYVMQQSAPVTAVVQQNQFIQPTAFVSQVVQQPPVQAVQTPEGYYVQPSPAQNYIVQNPAPGIITTGAPRQAFIAASNPQVVYQQPPQQQQQVNYVQYVATSPQQQQQSPGQPRIINSTTLAPSRQIIYRGRAPPMRMTRFPHPNGAVIRSAPLASNVLRPGQRVIQQRAIAPRPTRRQIASRTTAPNSKSGQTKVSAAQGQKTTSLIVLSDSDDEIEMIGITEKSDKAGPASAQKKPISIPPELMQRMSEGGISISPIKPAQPAATANQNTQLVVVVNETGSHYALALPNGSKLILTPEQVAQIRASNGGKLVL